MAAGKQVAIIGAALDLGAGRRGVDMGPSAIRYAGLHERLDAIGYDVRRLGRRRDGRARGDGGDGRTRPLPARDQGRRAAASRGSSVSRSSRTHCRSCSAATTRSRSGTLGGLARARGVGGVLWIDAHGDLNTPETSPSGNVHGMPLAAAIGLTDGRFASEHWTLPAVDPSRVALVGLRVGRLARARADS